MMKPSPSHALLDWLNGQDMAARKSLGRPMSMPDGQIAAIAKANGGAVATRNTRDFQECGIELVDPFVAAP